MRNIDLNSLYRKFGVQRFTVSDYIGGAPRRPYETQDAADFLDAGVTDGLLVAAPGPRGGKGYQIAPHAIAAARRREAASRRRADAEMVRWREQMRMREQRTVAEAVGLLTSKGYTVIPPEAG